MADLIDRQALDKDIEETVRFSVREGVASAERRGADKVIYRIQAAPTVDAVKVVRCKDCKHRGDYGCPMYHEEYSEWVDDGYHESEIIEHDRTRDDGFCDLGERRGHDGCM